MTENRMRANRENLCFTFFFRKAERTAMPKSSRLVSIIHYLQILFIYKYYSPINIVENVCDSSSALPVPSTTQDIGSSAI